MYDKNQNILKDSKFKITFKICREYVEVYIEDNLIHKIALNQKGVIKSQQERKDCIEILQDEGISEKYLENLLKQLDIKIEEILKLKPQIQYDSETNIFSDMNSDLRFEIKKTIIKIYKKDQFITILKLNNKHTIKSQKSINDAIDDITLQDKYISTAYLQQFMKKIDIKLNIQTEDVLDEIEEKKSSPDSFIYELRDSPSNSKCLAELAQSMMQRFSIIKTKSDDYFYFDEYYKPLSLAEYHFFVNQEFGLNLANKYAKESLSTISGIAEENYNIWEFSNNNYYNPIKKIVEKYEEPIITTRKFINNDILTNYNPDVKFFNDEPTFIEETLRQILIPRDNPKYTKLYMDFLYYLGSSLCIGNPTKMCVIYHGDGNNGKSALSFVIKNLFKQACFAPAAKELNNDFFFARADGENVIVIDEIKKGDLKKVEDVVKVLTSGSVVDRRQMHTTEIVKSLGYGTLFVLTNPMPIFTIEESLLNRMDIIDLPNFFKYTNSDDYDPDIHYPANTDIRTDIENDYEGFRWLANAIIKAYQEYNYKRQSNKITKSMLLGDNKLRKWLGEHLEIDNNSYISNREIYLKITEDDFTEYDIQNLPQRIGQALKELFGDHLEKMNTSPAKYNLKWIDNY